MWILNATLAGLCAYWSVEDYTRGKWIAGTIEALVAICNVYAVIFQF
jgi:hypothetical protein